MTTTPRAHDDIEAILSQVALTVLSVRRGIVFTAVTPTIPSRSVGTSSAPLKRSIKKGI